MKQKIMVVSSLFGISFVLFYFKLSAGNDCQKLSILFKGSMTYIYLVTSNGSDMLFRLYINFFRSRDILYPKYWFFL